MYECHICKAAAHQPKPFKVRMSATPFDEKLAFVEHVLGVLIESRYGWGREYSTLERPTFQTADEPNDLSELCDCEISWYKTAYQGRVLLQKPARSKGIALTYRTLGGTQSANPSDTLIPPTDPIRFPPTLGRGSP